MKALDPLKKLASLNEEKRKSLTSAIKQLASLLKASAPKLKTRDGAMGTHDFVAQFSVLSDNVKRLGIELAGGEEIESGLLREENFNNKIMTR